MNNKRKTVFTISILLLFMLNFAVPVSSSGDEREGYNWRKISGVWKCRKDDSGPFLYAERAPKVIKGYNELLNYNSIVVYHPKKYTSIRFFLEFGSAYKNNPVSIMAFFAEKNIKERPFRYFYAVRFTGSPEGIKRISFIHSDVRDLSKPLNQKWNFVITELSSRDFKLEYNRKYRVDLIVKRKNVFLFIDRKRILRARAKNMLNSGRFGFSTRNSNIKVSDVRAFRWRKIVFRDDFSEDKIFIPKAIFKKVSK